MGQSVLNLIRRTFCAAFCAQAAELRKKALKIQIQTAWARFKLAGKSIGEGGGQDGQGLVIVAANIRTRSTSYDTADYYSYYYYYLFLILVLLLLVLPLLLQLLLLWAKGRGRPAPGESWKVRSRCRRRLRRSSKRPLETGEDQL